MPQRKKTKCFSKCRYRYKQYCGSNICKYYNGKKYKYCRLGPNHKLDDNCNITLKNNKKNSGIKINKIINKNIKQKKAAKKINNFFKYIQHNNPSYLENNEDVDNTVIDNNLNVNNNNPHKNSKHSNNKPKKRLRHRYKTIKKICKTLVNNVSNNTRKIRDKCKYFIKS